MVKPFIFRPDPPGLPYPFFRFSLREAKAPLLLTQPAKGTQNPSSLFNTFAAF